MQRPEALIAVPADSDGLDLFYQRRPRQLGGDPVMLEGSLEPSPETVPVVIQFGPWARF